MIHIEDYMKLSRDDRRNHLDLKSACIERGGKSQNFRGLLAAALNTTIPSGLKIYLCHACHNGKCSNVSHLYWGTPKDNILDQIENNTWAPLQTRMQNLHGVDKWKSMASENMRRGQIKATELKRYSPEKIESYRCLVLKSNPMTRGWVKRASNLIGISYTQVRRFTDRFCKDMHLLKK